MKPRAEDWLRPEMKDAISQHERELERAHDAELSDSPQIVCTPNPRFFNDVEKERMKEGRRIAEWLKKYRRKHGNV